MGECGDPEATGAERDRLGGMSSTSATGSSKLGCASLPPTTGPRLLVGCVARSASVFRQLLHRGIKDEKRSVFEARLAPGSCRHPPPSLPSVGAAPREPSSTESLHPELPPRVCRDATGAGPSESPVEETRSVQRDDADDTSDAASDAAPPVCGNGIPDEAVCDVGGIPLAESWSLSPLGRNLASQPRAVQAPIATPTAVVAATELITRLARKVAWSSQRGGGSLRVEIGEGVLSGAVLLVEAHSHGVRIDLELPSGADRGAWQKRLDQRLTQHQGSEYALCVH